jgi:hypothetical protein
MLPAALTADEIEDRLAAGQLPQEFLSGWTRFLHRCGHRGPVELDVASPRYRDNPRMLLEQMAGLAAQAGTGDTPQARFERTQAARRRAYETLCGALESQSRLKRWRLRSLYAVIEHLGGYREIHKFYVILAMDRLSTRVLAEAEQLTRAGRLDEPAQVFDLEFGELVRALADSSFDLRAAAARNRAFPDRLARVRELPRMIDSRGRILRPPKPPARPGEVSGTPIAPGVVRGPVKVLHCCTTRVKSRSTPATSW